MITITRLHHVGVVVADLDQALHFFGETLGLNMVYSNPPLTHFQAGQAYIELILPPESDARREQPESTWTGLNHIALETTDLQAALTELFGRGVPLRHQTPRSLPNYDLAYLDDSVFETVPVELVQTTAPFPAVSNGGFNLELERVVLSFPDPASTARRFQQLLWLQPSATNRVGLSTGNAELSLSAGADEVGALVSVGCRVNDLGQLETALASAGVAVSRTSDGALELTGPAGLHMAFRQQ